MKRYLTVLSLIGLAAALQTGCIVTDAPFIGPDGVAWMAQNNTSNQTLDCLTLSNEGGGNIQKDVDIAVGFLCAPSPVGTRIFNPCVARMTKTQAERIWGRTGTGITDQQAATVYYGIGANTLAYEFAPNGIPEIGVTQPAYILRVSTVPTTDPLNFQFGCSQTNYNFAALPEGAERGSYGSDPSVVAIDVANGCQFFSNIRFKDASTWTTPIGGIYPIAGSVPPNRHGTGLKYTGALAVCYNQSNGTGNLGFLPDVVIKNLGCDTSFEIGALQTIALKSGEASMKYVVSLDEETGKMTAEVREVAVRGQSHVLTSPITFGLGASGRHFVMNQTQLGHAEVASWLLESGVDLSKPFTVGGEFLPFAKFVAPHTEFLVSPEGLQEIVRQAGLR